jgi:hypothetical protein
MSTATNQGGGQSPKLTSQLRRTRTLLSRAALEVLLSETINFLLAAGLPRQRVASSLRKEARRLGTPGRLLRSRATKAVQRGHENLGEIAGIVHDWHRQAVYTTRRTGEPRALRARELRALIAKRLPRERIGAALQWMDCNGIVSRRKDGRFVLSMGRQIVLRGRRLAMERAANLVPQYLRISLRNADTVNPYARDIDRDARVFFLPEKWVGLWRVIARERTEAFLEGVDNWLEDHTYPEDSGPVREVSLHCYGFTGEPRSIKASDAANERRGERDA